MRVDHSFTARCYVSSIAIVLVLLFPLVVLSQDYLPIAQQDVEMLCSAEFAGRGYVREGHKKAARYIQKRFAEIGLTPLHTDVNKGKKEQYYQSFKVKVNFFEQAPTLAVDGRPLKLGKDFLPHPHSGSGAIHNSDEFVRVGNGLFLPQQRINDFANQPVSGNVVIIDDHTPDYIRRNRAIESRSYSQEVKIEVARVLGASGVIFLVDRFRYSMPVNNVKIPVFQVLRKSFPAEISSLSFQIDTKFKKVRTKNVIAWIPAKLKTDSTIMLCAHYDHLGAIGDSVYFPGANDNASGVAMLLSLAQYFHNKPIPDYNLVFVAFSGEEAGLVGANYFVKKSPINLSRIRFVLNFDMVASGENGVVAVCGKDFPQEYKTLERINQQLGIGPLGARKNKAISDHFPFVEKGVKAFYLYTKDGKQPYHSTRDVPATLEWEDFQHVFELSKQFILQL